MACPDNREGLSDDAFPISFPKGTGVFQRKSDEGIFIPFIDIGIVVHPGGDEDRFPSVIRMLEQCHRRGHVDEVGLKPVVARAARIRSVGRSRKKMTELLGDLLQKPAKTVTGHQVSELELRHQGRLVHGENVHLGSLVLADIVIPLSETEMDSRFVGKS